MPRFLHFIKTFHKKQFFKLPPEQKAKLLLHDRFYFFAGLYYMEAKKYKEATLCFEHAKAYKHLIIAYQKQGLYSKALLVAQEHGYYDLGAKLCLHIENNKKAASFYSYKKPLKAAKLYEKDGFYFEAGMNYLKAYEPIKAYDAFNCCSNIEDKQKGFAALNEFSLVLYFTKHYENAFEIFLALGDYYSALDCAKKLREPILIKSTTLLLAADEAENAHFLLAGKCAEQVAPEHALIYYAQGKSYYDMIRLLISREEYDKAINLCLLQEQFEMANEIANTYNSDLMVI